MSLIAKRFILRFPFDYGKEEENLLSQFRSLHLQDINDYFLHYCADPSSTSKMLVVIDVFSAALPETDPRYIEHQVYNVRKNAKLEL